MKLANTLSIAILVSVLASHADEVPKPYECKSRSSFSLRTESRSPFWPIGWQPTVLEEQPKGDHPEAAPAVASVPKFQLSGDSFNVSSVLLGNPALANINGRSFGEGEYLPVVSNAQRLKVQVYAIREQGVWLRLDDQQPVLVPIRRGEIRQKAAPQVSQEWTIKLTNK